MNTRQSTFLIFFFFFGWSTLIAQSTQNIRGTVIDKQSEMPLIGVAVEFLGGEEVRGTTTDIDGQFVLEDIPVGRQTLRFSYLGYQPVTIPNIVLTAGKEMVLNVGMEESIVQMDEIVVRAGVEKDKANNEMATISSRSFTLEEVTRYSGGRNDVSRLAANFAGVNIADDSRNDIVVRGNSPTGVLWRLEGVPIPNPNHFSTLGTTGGPVSAINTNLLKNSDFLTSAFPAEYGNALAGVFDVGFRSGNKDQFEFTAQLAAFSGLEFMAEGPINRNKTGSFLISYRHSFTELADLAGLDFGTSAIPRYKDLSFKVDLPRMGKHKVSLFGIGATSTIDFIGSDLNEDDFFADNNINSYVTSTLGIAGINHRFLIDNKTYLATTVAASTSQNTYNEDRLEEGANEFRQTEVNDINDRYSVHTYLNRKFTAKWTLRSGILVEALSLNTFVRDRVDTPDWQTIRDFDDIMLLTQPYAQTQYRINPKWTLNAGLRAQHLSLNNTWAVEPRAAVNWHVTPQSTFSIGYGLHNQMQPLPIYFIETRLMDGPSLRTNEDLDFTRSHHFVLGYDQKLGVDWRLKMEAYYQDLRQVPVESDPSSFSILNAGADFVFPQVDYLVNEGSGENYGLEVTLEKFFSKGYYTLVTGSLFESKYTGSDGIRRNTAFNNNYTLNFLAGKEFKFGKTRQNAFTFDMKFTTAGGRYFTPINKEASKLAGREIRDESKAFSEQFDPYLRLDLKFGYQLNSKKRKLAQQFFLDFQNVTNRQNIFTQRYSVEENEVFNVYQIGFFPDVLYRVQF
jgi:hypothetical protein